MNSWVLSVPVSHISELSQILWEVDGKRYSRTLDTEDIDDTGNWYTFPLVTEPRRSLSVRVISGITDPIEVSIIGTDTESYRTQIVWD